jgi:putative ABC transport system substrate-binding protein
MPVIGYLGSASADATRSRIAAFRQGLAQAGYFEGQNVAIEYRWADSKYVRLPDMASDIPWHKVTTGGWMKRPKFYFMKS